MRSLIILEVEHGEDTDALESMVQAAYEDASFRRRTLGRRVKIVDYTVRVDLPESFVLESTHFAPVWCEGCDLDHDPNFCPSHLEA